MSFMEQRVPVQPVRLASTKFKIHRPLVQRLKRTVLWPFRKIGASLLGRILDKARYEIVYLTFHGYNVATCSYIAAKLGVFDHLKSGPKSAAELASLTQADEDNLYRILRGLAAIRFLHQSADKTFSLSPLGELLTEDHPRSLRHWALQWGQDVLPVLPSFENQIQEGSANAFLRTHGQSYWDYLDQNPEQSLSFDKKMSRLTVSHIPAVVAAYDFSKCGTIVDVGGGRGALLCEILRKHPAIRGVLYDRPEVEPSARECLAETGMADRCQIVTGSFLESVPAEGDTYLIKHVLHDWDDESVLRILKNIRAAMQPGQRLLIMEGFLEHDHFGLDSFRKWTDIYQMVYLPGKQRTLDEMRDLLAQAGMEMESLTPTIVPDLAVLECVAVG
jgi:hypothetical protein